MTRRGSCPARVLQLGGVTALITNLQQRCATTTKSSPMTFDTASFRKKATCTLLLGTKGHGVEPYLRTVLDSSAFSLHAPSTPILHQIHPRPRKSVDSQKLFTTRPPNPYPCLILKCTAGPYRRFSWHVALSETANRFMRTSRQEMPSVS